MSTPSIRQCNPGRANRNERRFWRLSVGYQFNGWRAVVPSPTPSIQRVPAALTPFQAVCRAFAAGLFVAAAIVAAAVPPARASEPPLVGPPLAGPPLVGSVSRGPPAALLQLFARPAASPRTPRASAEIALGKALFNEPALSAEGRTSCATCHQASKGFADGLRLGRGRGGASLDWHTPTLWNLAEDRAFFWNGRVLSLEAQARAVITHPSEMGLPLDQAAGRLNARRPYVGLVGNAFGPGEIDEDRIVRALAAYVRSLRSPITQFDRVVASEMRFTGQQLQGFEIFTGKGRCLACHGGWRMTDGRFHDIGLGSTLPGHGGPQGNPESRAMKTPGLRGVRFTAPYMHNGSLPNLRAVVDHYADNKIDRLSLAPELKRGITLSEAERRALVAFLKTL